MRAKPPATPNHRLRLARLQRGWSQEHLADQLGTNAFTIGRWEQGRAFPRPYFRQRLAELFAQSPEALGLLRAAAQPASDRLLSPPASPRASGSLAEAMVCDPLLPLLQAPKLIGRDLLLAQLKARLLAGEALILSALQGLPGVGKTALALALAHDEEVRGHFADGILWAGLGQTPHVLETLVRWGALLGLSTADTSQLTTIPAWAQTLRSLLSHRRLLLVLDDVWRLEDVLACQVGGSGCAYVVTTRRQDLALQVAGAGLATVPELPEEKGLMVLAQFVPQMVAAEPEEARALVRAVGGLPLGLLLLGKYLSPRRIPTNHVG